MTHQIKIFSGSSQIDIEGQVNRFLERAAEAEWNIDTVQLQVTQSGNFVLYTLLVVFDAPVGACG